MIVRNNPDLDDAFGLPTVGQWEEARRLGIPVEQVPRRGPTGTALPPTSKRLPRRLTADEEAFLAMLLADKANETAEREIARPGPTGNDSVPIPTATQVVAVWERPGEDLLFLNGRWYHRCQHCDPRKLVLIPDAGHNPRTATRPLFTVPRDETIRHVAGCPHAGQF